MKKKNRTLKRKTAVANRKTEAKNRVGNYYEMKINTNKSATHSNYSKLQVVKPAKQDGTLNIGAVVLQAISTKVLGWLGFNE